MTKITSPINGFTGDTLIGSLPVTFEDGSAHVEDLSDGARAYLLSAGYKVGGKSVDPPASVDGAEVQSVDKVDSRDVAEPEQFGTKLRDAAVDPEKSDFLPPTNAGKEDPHGPDVVSPEIHASQGIRPVKGGEVHVGDPAVQSKAELEHAAAATDGTPVEPLASEKPTKDDVLPATPKPPTAAKKAAAKKTTAKKAAAKKS